LRIGILYAMVLGELGHPPTLIGEGHRCFLTMPMNTMKIWRLPLQQRYYDARLRPRRPTHYKREHSVMLTEDPLHPPHTPKRTCYIGDTTVCQLLGGKNVTNI